MNDRFVKLCDFGLATVHNKRVHYRTTRKHTTDVGHPSYVPLEVMRGEKYGPKADVHNVGLIGGEIFEFDLFDCDSNKISPLPYPYSI
ncbi:unnamed protein product [Oppiella nova]|uniref:Protein kinase domain-containing protein n=1 Tax=Oppiella nova TaxID=334625 RepID=A0A7R9LVQ9_9ACAR|nr:unnamed protein product [Oppiella nova]CAG2166779.1 unnamed protein product [Oppiella nova]